AGGNRLVLLMPDAEPRIVAEAAGNLDLAELAFLQEFHRLLEPLVGAALGARLADLPVLARRLDDLPAFPDVVADGFLDVDVLSGLEGPDRQQRVRMVGGRDRDGVDRLVLDQLPEVLV